jgi:hypothetical protein
MGVTDKVWGAPTSMIKLEEKVNRQAEAIKTQQKKIEDLTGRVIRSNALGSASQDRRTGPPGSVESAGAFDQRRPSQPQQHL